MPKKMMNNNSFDDDEDDEASLEETKEDSNTNITSSSNTLSAKKLETFKNKINKRGIIYVSRIPPGMTPTSIRRYMSQFGTVHRIFLSPENPHSAKKRRKSGGNRGKRYTEGWVEFDRKKIAKYIAASLNNKQIGGRRRSNYHDDLWNIKYLKGFKWHHMTEQAAYAKAVRESKIREELSQSRKETAFYIQKVQQSKMERRRKKRKTNDDVDDGDDEIHRVFRQRKTIKHSEGMDDHILNNILSPSSSNNK